MTLDGLTKMREYLVTQQGSERDARKVSAIVEAYFTSVVVLGTGGTLGMRSQQETRSLGRAIDLLVKGELASACDVLMQRFKAVKLGSTTEGGWSLGRQLELVPTGKVSALPQSELELAAKMEKDLLRIQVNRSGAKRDAPS